MPGHQPPAHLSDDEARLRHLLQHLERADYCVRPAETRDLAALKVLERRCWPKGLRTRKSILRKRIERYPQGQLVLTVDDAVVGVIYSQLIADLAALDGITAARVDRLHDRKARIVQLLAVNILPESQHLDLGDRLLEFMLIYRSLQDDVDSVVAVTLCRSFDRARDATLDDYIRRRNEHGALADPILRFHELHGATIERVVPGYRPTDSKNEGSGVLVTYDIRRRSRRDVAVSAATTRRSGPELRRDIEAAVRACLGAERQAEYASTRPLMEMGLDSADLLQLREIIAQRHQMRLNAAFFFEHNTVEKIVDHLGDRPVDLASPARHTDANAARDVAIVGMACRLPGGIGTPAEFWESLKAGVSAIGSLPAGRWQWPDGIDPAGRHKGIDRGGFLQDVACFDAPFFRISPAEAQSMDPQQRLLLELGWQAIEQAGYAPKELAGSATGVFIGASGSDYARLLDQSGQPAEAHYGAGSSMAVLANRLSYFFDLKGPSLLIDTACSSSLVALHKAVQSIASGESAQALVGGVNLILHPANSIAYYKAGMLAKDGLCKTFDRRADGYVRSEGAVVLLLKPLATALADRDTIHAVIKGTACNHGGLASGLTVPKPGQQAALLQAAWRDAGIDPAALGYIEAHGTGTALGDPIEIQGIREALGSAEVRCGVGSVKTNLGHLEAAAGLAGVLKAVLCLQHGEIPASLHFRDLNEHIDLPDGLFVVDRPMPWPGPRLAGVSSFGSGGTNAHVVVAEAPAIEEVAVAVGSPKRRVALPAHPFARHRYWVPGVEMQEEIAPVLLAPVWNRVEVGAAAAIDAQARVLIVGGNEVQHQMIRAVCPSATTDIADPDRVFWIAQQDLGVLPLFRFVKTLLARGYGGRTLDLTLVTSRTQAVFAHDAIDATHAGIHGFAGALAKEQPRWSIRALDIGSGEAWPIGEALALPPNAEGEVRAHRNGIWFQRFLAPVSALPMAPPPYRQNGVYVVVGGAGGTGEAWTRHVAERYQAQVVWIGRRPLDAAIQAKLDGVAARGPAPVYLSADASVLESLQAARAEIRQRWPAIHGVIHAATGAFDRSIAEMDEPRFAEILSVKLDASLNVAKVFETEPLDFLLYFSSIVALEKDGGLSGYAAGGAFEDALALELAGRGVPARVVNWGHWQVGTGAALAETRKTRLRRSGHLPIESAEAMTALYSVLASPLTQVAVLKTSRLQSMPLVDTGRRLLVAADTIPSSIGQIPSAPATDIEALRSSSLFANEAMEEALLPSLAAALDKVDRKNVIGSYGRWLAASTKLLAGRSSRDAPNWREQVPAAAVELAEACLQALPDILTGRVRATDVLFPGSSMRRVEGIYRGNSVADHFNRVLADALVAAVDALLKDDPDARIRILEVGAGTGGTTAALLPRLAPFRLNIVEYAYTDLSKAFLFHAEEQFVGAYPFVQPKMFDIEKPLAGQGIEAQRYDFVIATNVLHATRDIRRTLANCKAALARNGLLLLNEIATQSLFAHLTFGLLEGWWLAQDQALRMPDAPGLFPATWQTVLKQEGFPAVHFPAPESHVLGQQVIVAESDGVVWQEEVVAMPPPAKATVPRAVANSAAPETLKAAANTLLRKLVAKTLRMDASQVDVHEPLEAYGIDSILVVQIVDALRESFSDVRGTLLFECQTVDALAEHFVRNHADEVARLTGVRAEAVVAPAINIREAPAVADDSISVIGMSCRFPQAPTVEAFWQLLKSGLDCVGEIPEDRWSLEDFFHADPDEAVQRGKSYAKWGAFLDGVTEFDPLFFNISPKDAVAIDPQERLFLQTAWEALEDAGYTRQRLAQDFDRRLGVFVGITRTGFDLFGPDLWRRGETLYPHTSFSSVANRLSYFLDARGPSVPVDTMCSSSLTAIHQACQSLSSGECRLAIAGGVNVYLHPSGYVGLSASRMLSKDGLCRSFGKGGDGFVPGEGVAAVLLKPLSRAIADGDRIQAVIRATHVNHGGKTNGYTVPNPQAQAELVREAIEKAGVDARAVSYVEAHGTGTELGDPIEVTGLTQAFRHFTPDTGFCALGSAKTNIGHLEAAAGIAGFIKVVLQMQHRQLVPSLHSAELNPGIDFARTPFVVQQRLEEWRSTGPRLAGVSSFGAGGANAHVIVEEYAAPAQAAAASPHGAVIVLSARNEERLKAHACRLRDFIASSAPDLSDLAYTLQVGREQMEQRLGLVVHSLEELRQRLDGWLAGSSDASEIYAGNARQHRELISAFANDASMQETMGVWFARGDHARVLGLWSKGLNVDWRTFHPAPGRLIGLPTYPFETAPYWLPVVEQEKVEQEKPAISRPQGIKLQDPALLPTSFAVDTAIRQHTLRPLESYAPAEEAALSVRDLGDGILTISVQGQTSAVAARAGLAACVDWVNASPPKVLILGGLDRLFPGGDAEALASLANCTVPTIALPSAGSMAAACDIAAASEEAALATARDIARASTTALVELKRNLSRAAAQGPDTAWPATPAVAAVQPLERVALRSQVVTLDRQANGVVVMTLCDRAARNTSSPDLVRGVIEAFEHIKATPAYKAVVLTGYDTYFACGGTKEGLLAIQSGAIRFTDEQSYALPLACDIPVIAAMQGHGIGAGWAMGLFCDWAVYSEESVYRSPYMLYGFTPGAGSTLVFPHRLGDGLAREILFTARDFTGRELKQRGIDMPVVPRKGVVARALGLANHLATSSRQELVQRKAERSRVLREQLPSVFARELAMHDKTFVGNAQVVANVERHFNLGAAQEEAVPSSKAVGPAPDRASQQEVLETLAQSLADELLMRREQVDETAAFTDIGMDSISAVMWVKKINSRFGLSLTATKVYHYPSLKHFADFVLSQMGDRQQAKAAEVAPAEPPKPSRESAPVRTFALVERPQEVERPREFAPRETSPAIAIIGMAGQFPKASDVKQFWRNIAQGRECVSEIPSSRWSIDAYYDADRSASGKTVCRRMGFLDDVDLFDPLFFNISPSEAELMDPQQRLFLQSSWHCIEDAGYNPKDLSGTSCGVFVGCAASDYSQLVAGGANSAQALIGESVSILPARIAYFLNLQGPCLAIDTACSASLVALATACDSLVLGNSDIALAGGVYVINGPDIHVKMSSAGMLSPDGRCFSFDQRANGFVPGEGVGVVLLKRLADAERDGDDIYAVVRGWGVNQDGKTNGITAPNQESQTRLESGIYRKFGIDPEHIQLVEAHGTGTKLGDPIEVDALCASFRQFTGKEQFCALGSVKTNIGHLATAAGVAGVIKSVLALQKKQLPPTINYQSLNEHIRLQGSPFYVNTECRPWPVDPGRKRLAAVSSFGFSGTNAHVVLEEYAPRRAASQSAAATSHDFSLSARSREQLGAYVRALADYLANDHDPREVSLADLARSFRIGRPLFEHRATFAARSFDELRQQLGRYVATGETVAPPSQAIDAGEGRRRHGLPAYPFERERYWAAPLASDEWQVAELTDAVDWQGRLRHILSRQILVVHSNDETRTAFDHLLVQLKQAAGVEKASVTYCAPAGLETATATLRPGHVVHLDEGAIVVGGQRRLVIGQSDRGDLNVVMQRLFKEWLAFDAAGVRLREIRYAGARRLVRWAAAEEESGSICTLAKEWRLKAPEPLAQPPHRVTLLLLVNAETAPFAAQLFKEDFDETIVVDETNLGDARLAERYDSITHIVDLTDLHGEPADSDGDPSDKVALYQALVGGGSDLSILHVTKGLQFFRSMRLSLAGAKFAGLVRMLGAEYRHVNARCLDIDQLVLDDPHRLRRILLQEFDAALQETELCYREGHRFAPVLTAVESDDPAPGAFRIDPAAVYVISGGTNGVGLEIAKFLADKGCRKLVLMGITELPPKEGWAAAVTKGNLPPYVAAKLGELIALDKRLDHLGIYTGPLTAQATLRSHFVKVRATVGPIRGVIHAAAVYSDAGSPGFAGKSPARMRQVWDAKMGGLESLQAIFKADPLDFFVAFSSMTALVPRLARGASDYAMANGFVEFFTAYHRSQPGGERFRSIMWSDWNQSGAITRIAPDKARAVMETFERLGLRTFSNREGAVLFERAMTGPDAVSIVAYLDRERFEEVAPHLLFADPDSPDGPRLAVAARTQSLKAVPRSIQHQLEQWEAEKRAGGTIPIARILEVISLEEIKLIDPAQIHRLHKVMFGEATQVAPPAPSVDQAEIVAATVRDVLKLKSVDPAKPFQDYGLDSISATVLATRLEKKLKREVQPKWLIDFPTVDALVRFLIAEDEVSAPRSAAPSTPAE